MGRGPLSVVLQAGRRAPYPRQTTQPGTDQIDRKANPCFKERHVEGKAYGYLLRQDTLYAGKLKEVVKVYMQTVVDTY